MRICKETSGCRQVFFLHGDFDFLCRIFKVIRDSTLMTKRITPLVYYTNLNKKNQR